jgi:magnesium chelatase family protein
LRVAPDGDGAVDWTAQRIVGDREALVSAVPTSHRLAERVGQVPAVAGVDADDLQRLPEHVCTDSPAAVQRYQSRVSGPFLDRIDLVVPVTPLTHHELANPGPGEPSAVVRERILVARARQRERLADTPWANNAEIPSTGDAVERLCPLTEDANKQLLELAHRRNLGMRALHRLRRVARSIQDLDRETNPRQPIAVDAVSLAARLRVLPDTLMSE